MARITDDEAYSISIHALREEGDNVCFPIDMSRKIFLSTPSARRATLVLVGIKHVDKFLSTPSARRATRVLPRSSYLLRNFYPRPPRGGRHGNGTTSGSIKLFLSTPSARRATFSLGIFPPVSIFLSTPSARRATLPWPFRHF